MDQHSKLGYREGLVSVILNLLLFVLKDDAGIPQFCPLVENASGGAPACPFMLK